MHLHKNSVTVSINQGSNIPFKEELHDDITKVAPNLKLYPGKNSTAEYTFPLLFVVWEPS
jgi:hypothetical protein